MFQRATDQKLNTTVRASGRAALAVSISHAPHGSLLGLIARFLARSLELCAASFASVPSRRCQQSPSPEEHCMPLCGAQHGRSHQPEHET